MPWWSQGALYASSTLTVAGNTALTNASSTLFTNSGQAWVGGITTLTGNLNFTEGANNVIGFADTNMNYGERLRVTAGNMDTADNSQGASIDFHGNNHASAGQLDLVAGGATGDITAWTNNMQRLVLDQSGLLSFGNATSSLLTVSGQSWFNISDFTATSTFAKGISIASSTPDVTSNALYNNGSILYWNGSDISTATTDNWTFATNYGTTTLTATSTMPWWSQGALYASSTLTVAGNTTFDTNTLFVDASSNRVAIGTTSPLTALQIVGGFTAGNSVTGAGDQSVGTDIINFIVGSTIASTTANTETVLRLARNGTPSDKYNPSIDFNVGSYANSGINAQTQLDIRLGEGGIHIPDTTVMSLLSSGNVGIGTTSPVATLGVNGTSYFTATSTFAKGISIASSTPDVTTNALYNNAGTLFWNGSDISTATTDNWTFATNYGTTTLTATSTMPWWSQGALYASSTLTVAGNTALTNASSTLFTNSGLSWFDGNATFDTNTLFVDASNNRVGIGTTSPVALLNVVNNDNTEGGISIDVSNTGGGAQATLGFKPNTATSSKIGQNGQLGWNITARGSNYATAGEQNDLHFEYYNGAGWVSPMHFDVTGNVGIGTTSPFTTLGISGDSYFTATSTFAKGISIASSTPDVTSNALYNNGSILYWNGSDISTATTDNWTFATNYGTTTLTATSTMPWWSQGALYASSTLTVAGNTALTNASSTLFTNSGLSWFDGNATFDTNTLFVDASNNRVGIGTTSPDSLLHVNGLALVGANSLSLGGYFPADNSQTPEGLVVYASSSATTLDNAGGIYVHNENQATGTLSSIHFSSKNTTNSNVAYSSIVGVSGARNAAFFGGDLAFYTRANNATTQSERMRITSTGNVGIGTTSPFTTLGISGDSYFTATSTFAKGISIASSTPDITSNALYNNAGTLYWNGSAVGAITGTEGQTVVMNSSGTQVATSTLFITSASRVGIGTTTPSGRLHVSNGNSGVAVNGNVDDFIVEGTDSGVGLTIASPDTSSARIAFGDQVNSIAGLIAYQHPTDDMFFGTFNGSYRMTINSAGNVGIGTTSPFTTLGISGDSYFTATSTFAKGISIASSTPDVTSNALYNNGSTLYWNGNTVNTGATRESAILASWDGRGDPTVSGYSFPTATLSGNASYDSTNKWVRLTPAVSDQDGSIEWEFNPGNAMKTSFEFRAGGGTGADATWFYVYSTTTPTDEGDANGGYIIALDEYDGDEIQVLYDTTLLGSVSPGNIDDNQWHRVDVVIENARIDVFWDGEKQISVQDKLGRDILGTKMGFGARAGGNTNNHDIRNLEVVKSNSDYLFVNRQSYTSIATSTAISTTTFSSIYTPFNFGVGTTTPASKLSVVGDIDAEFSATSTRIIGMGLNGGFVAGKTAIFRMGDVANQIEVSHGAPMDIRSFHGTRFYDNTGEIARIGINSASTDSYFNGNVGIGGETSPDFALDVYGTICQDTNSDDTCDGTVTSDERLKENVVQIEDALDKIMQLRGVHFEWDKTNSHTEFLGDGRQTGLIAQEVEVLFPELVYEDMQGYKMIDYQKLTALNLEAIKEQQEMIEVLQNELNSLSLGGSVEEFITNQELNGAFVANRILAREEICIGEEGGEVCLNKEELAELKGMLKNDQSSTINDQSISNESIINENTDSVDVESPIIILLGNNPAKIEVGSTYSDMGATVTDNVNDNLGYKVSIDGGEEMYPNELSLDTSSTTTYVITFIAEDQAGNVGTTTRIVEVGVHTPQDVGSPTSLIEGTTSTTTATELNTPKNPTDLTGQAELIQEQEPELILGCMDPDALNHDESATEDDLSCEYEEHVVEEPVSTTTPETI